MKKINQILSGENFVSKQASINTSKVLKQTNLIEQKNKYV